METLRDYICLIESEWERVGESVQCPARIRDADPPLFDWDNLNPCQQLVCLFLWGAADERHAEPVATVLASKPAAVSWRHLIKASFDFEMRRAPIERLDFRNRRD